MARSQKGPQKKASPKKAKVKARANAQPKKAAKATTKRPAKAAVKSAAKAAPARPTAPKPKAAIKRIKEATKSPAKKPSTKKGVSEDVTLYQNFIASLGKLETYWKKEVIALKKQLDTLTHKHEKALSKGNKSNSAKKDLELKEMQEMIENIRDALTIAELTASKYYTLSKHIDQFEKEWLQDAQPLETAKPQPTSVDVYKRDHKLKNESHAPLADAIQHWEEVDEVEEEEIVDDLEDIFMPQDELSEFEVIEDFSVTTDEDLFNDEDA